MQLTHHVITRTRSQILSRHVGDTPFPRWSSHEKGLEERGEKDYLDERDSPVRMAMQNTPDRWSGGRSPMARVLVVVVRAP
jgi:hypothetical protein